MADKLRADLDTFAHHHDALRKLAAAMISGGPDHPTVDQLGTTLGPAHARVAVHLDEFVGATTGHLVTTGLVGIWHELGATLAVLSERIADAARTLSATDQADADKILAATQIQYAGAGAPPPQTLPGGSQAVRQHEIDFVQRVLRGQT